MVGLSTAKSLDIDLDLDLVTIVDLFLALRKHEQGFLVYFVIVL